MCRDPFYRSTEHKVVHLPHLRGVINIDYITERITTLKRCQSKFESMKHSKEIQLLLHY